MQHPPGLGLHCDHIGAVFDHQPRACSYVSRITTSVRGHISFHATRLVLGCGSLGEVGFIPELNPLFALLFRLAAICDPTYVTLGRWFVFKTPRGDTNGVDEDEVTLTSARTKEEGGLHGHIRCRFRQRSRTG